MSRTIRKGGGPKKPSSPRPPEKGGHRNWLKEEDLGDGENSLPEEEEVDG